MQAVDSLPAKPAPTMDSNAFLVVSDHIFCFDRPKW